MYTVKHHAYSLEIDGAQVRVILDGCAVATLDMRSAVHQTSEAYERIADEEPELPVLVRAEGDTFIWKGKSSLWEEKTYTLTCTPRRFLYRVTVKGKGRVDGVEYFSANGKGSGYEFSEGLNPCRAYPMDGYYCFPVSKDFHREPALMVPPMFCYVFRTEKLGKLLSLGLAAEPGEHNFHAFDYHCVSDGPYTSAFYLSTDQDGHTAVDGTWTAPHILGYGAEDKFEALREYADYYFSSGLAKAKPAAVPPKFWHGPMACGWIEQYANHLKTGVDSIDMARQDLYESYVERLHAAGLYPRVLIIDDKWQKYYATQEADTEKWPDLRGFADRMRGMGIHTLLWFRVFDSEGYDAPELCVDTESYTGYNPLIDPSHPHYLALLDRALHRIISADEGCYNCDGIKIDYAFLNPKSRKFRTYSGKYGTELLYDMMKHIYETIKAIKPEAIVNCSPCHPYFAHLCDQGRLHDYQYQQRDCAEDLEMRAKMFRAAMPGTLLDCDNAGFQTRRDTMRWMLKQPLTGVPDLYCLSPLPNFGFSEADLEELAAVWREYTARIDARYPEV